MSKMSDGGKGSSPRPFDVNNNTFESNWKAIEGFGESWLERKKRQEALQKLHDVNVELGLYDNPVQINKDSV
jgi:hypothetical protein